MDFIAFNHRPLKRFDEPNEPPRSFLADRGVFCMADLNMYLSSRIEAEIISFWPLLPAVTLVLRCRLFSAVAPLAGTR